MTQSIRFTTLNIWGCLAYTFGIVTSTLAVTRCYTHYQVLPGERKAISSRVSVRCASATQSTAKNFENMLKDMRNHK
ncbi:hypothetical protein F4680DRAFT_401779 [Xylaria scruposa]|nr:hypothetical protein F4680DRAFT_401779 [Xylaria scruposa]